MGAGTIILAQYQLIAVLLGVHLIPKFNFLCGRFTTGPLSFVVAAISLSTTVDVKDDQKLPRNATFARLNYSPC